MINVGFSNDGRQVLLRPLFGGHVLLENHHLLEAHLLKLLGVFEDDGRQNIEAEREVVALVSQVGVKESQASLH